MSNLQAVSIIAAFPISVVIVLIAISFLKDAGGYMEERSADAEEIFVSEVSKTGKL